MDTLLPGLRGMLNWHPLVVHFPIAFWLGALFFGLIAWARGNEEWHRTSVRLLYLGTFTAFFAVGTGLLAEEAVPEGAAHEVMELHEKMMLVTTSFAVGLCLIARLLREKIAGPLRGAFVLGLLLLAAMLIVGADRGGQLVYHFGAGVGTNGQR